jgi:polysaccharide export outer membrane protein
MKVSLTISGMLLALACTGCYSAAHHQLVAPLGEGPPRELSKAVLPPYLIEPPDILVIEALSATPREPYRLRSLDVISLQVAGTLPEEPIEGLFRVERGGVIILGGSYGSVKISGMNVSQAEAAIQKHLEERLRMPIVTLTLAETAGTQQISGEHLVAPDGTVTLGAYGNLSVVGLTIPQAKYVIEQHLSQHFEDPEVSVNVFAYNSKVYYVITQGAGLGDGVYRFPITGNETVLDAAALINGFDQTSSCKMWVARPGPDKISCDSIMPVDWCGITKYGDVTTNYQLMPGDRLYVAEDKWVALDTKIGKITSPFERLFGFSTLGADTVTRFSGKVLQGGGDTRFQGNQNASPGP